MTGSPNDILARLQEAARRDLRDFLTFEVGPEDDHPDIQNDGMQYDGPRFRAECRLAGKIYGQRFGVDVAFGDPILGEPEVVVVEDLLAFAGIAPPTRDLPDIALLATAQAIGAKRLRDALEQTFMFRKTNSLPDRLPEPLSTWETPYAAMARVDPARVAGFGRRGRPSGDRFFEEHRNAGPIRSGRTRRSVPSGDADRAAGHSMLRWRFPQAGESRPSLIVEDNR